MRRPSARIAVSYYQTFHHHWGSIILPTGYVSYDVHASGGSPSGVSEVESRAGLRGW
jgi:NAD(P)H dehydrogenase (quinone)